MFIPSLDSPRCMAVKGLLYRGSGSFPGSPSWGELVVRRFPLPLRRTPVFSCVGSSVSLSDSSASARVHGFSCVGELVSLLVSSASSQVPGSPSWGARLVRWVPLPLPGSMDFPALGGPVSPSGSSASSRVHGFPCVGELVSPSGSSSVLRRYPPFP